MLTTQDISNIISGGIKHLNYLETVALARPLLIHANGIYPSKIIDERRPNEDPSVKAYRAKIYQPITKKTVNKVITSLGKIRRSADWTVLFNQENIPPQITVSESLYEYCEKRYPLYTSVTNWVFAELMKRYLIDANSLVAVLPKSIPANKNEYIKPVARIFGSEQVYWYTPEQHAVLLSSETVQFKNIDEAGFRNGKVFYYIDTEKIERYEESEKGYSITWSYIHNFGMLPVFKVGGQYMDEKNNDIIYESRIASMIPSLDEAAREYSDLQAEIVQHIHSEKYVYANIDCPECNGVGKVMNGGELCDCGKCNGIGSIRSVSPYGLHLITPSKMGESAIPTPPIGYVQKQTDIAMLQDTRVKGHLRDALSSLNMEFLAETPLNQSGVAKEVDRDELNIFVNYIAEDIVAIMDRVYYFTNEYRYTVVVPNREKREIMLPAIPVPEKYDLLSASLIISDLKTAKEAGVNPVIVRELEIEYAKKKFNTNPEKSYFLQATYTLDPLPGITDDEKMTRLSNGGVTETAYIVSSNIIAFVQRAVFENPDFYGKDLKAKQDIVEKYALEVQQTNSAANEVRNALMQQQQPPVFNE